MRHWCSLSSVLIEDVRPLLVLAFSSRWRHWPKISTKAVRVQPEIMWWRGLTLCSWALAFVSVHDVDLWHTHLSDRESNWSALLCTCQPSMTMFKSLRNSFWLTSPEMIHKSLIRMELATFQCDSLEIWFFFFQVENYSKQSCLKMWTFKRLTGK